MVNFESLTLIGFVEPSRLTKIDALNSSHDIRTKSVSLFVRRRTALKNSKNCFSRSSSERLRIRQDLLLYYER